MDGHDGMAHAQRAERIRSLNDQLRTTGHGGSIYLTAAVAGLATCAVGRLMSEIQQFADFTADNDPWGEHDFGKVELDGAPYFWKIDAYDQNLEFGSPDSANPEVTRRVMTIMTASDL
ncbi:DUF3768 domain-containing protein [Sphingomonas immobilis]|uniref:DUF3768 domain-containing protein n=1 Tax=Sphingomonas immobilis TaxID=3063997 RepID=A0ABT9A1Q7_9SPHN|nr:DUF3768 domain-containing protein [Sphingomonas sp. CA1-15]MDO7843765.1 DUF3768 domain-containing protein [Sphingomonas sp. CA1-15]